MAELVVVKDRFEIDASKPLPQYDSPNAKAYACRMNVGDHPDMIALVCDPKMPLRVEALEPLRGCPGRGLIRFVDHGVVNWAETRRRQAVLMFDRPGGPRVFSKMTDTIDPMSDDRIIRGFLTPVIVTLRELSQRGVAHRNIRPSNLFYTDDSLRLIMLGECGSAPPGYNQPIFFESLECGMADQTARGEGGILDDLFAVGVTVLSLLIGRQPMGNVEPSQHVFDRINAGSYPVIVGSHRIQMNWMELLRGLLMDDPRERWGIRDVELWIGGRRLTPKQVKLPPKAARPMLIGGGSYENIRAVAHALGRNWAIAGELVKGQDFDNWMRRSLSDERVLESVVKVAGSNVAMQTAPKSEEARLVTRVCIGLDPSAPLRHKGFTAHIDGFGPTLALGFGDDTVRQRVADMINARVLPQWMSLQNRTKSDVMLLYSRLEKMPGILNQTGPGYGIERCLYELNPHIQCLSPMVEHLYVTRSEELLPALEAVAQARDVPPAPMDRHIAAFLGARSPEVDDRMLRPLATIADRPSGDIINVLRILSRVQVLSRNGPMPALARWIATLCKPAVNAFHNLKVRRAVEIAVERSAESGLLTELQKIFDDVKAVQRDENAYRRCQQEYAQCSAQVSQMGLDLQNRDNLASELGEQVAAVVSGVIGSVGATTIIVLYML